MLEKARAQFADGSLARMASRSGGTQTRSLYAGRGNRSQHGETLMTQIDHLGIAVKSLAAAKSIYEKLGLSVSPEETVEQEQVRLVMVPVGESRLELLEATSENSTIAKFIAKRGEGLHHVCLRVPGSAGGRRALEERRSPSGFRRNQDRRRRAPICLRASCEHGRRSAGIGAGIDEQDRPRVSADFSRIDRLHFFMLLLAIDTSGKYGSLALARAGEPTADGGDFEVIEIAPLAGGTFSAQLIPQIAELLSRNGFDKSAIGAFVVASGPGSFTGLRIGLAAVKALAEVLGEADCGGVIARSVRLHQWRSGQGDGGSRCRPERRIRGGV